VKKCPKCGKPARVKVNLFLDIDVSLAHGLSKTVLRSKKVAIDGADWPNAVTYCTNIRCSYGGRGIS